MTTVATLLAARSAAIIQVAAERDTRDRYKTTAAYAAYADALDAIAYEAELATATSAILAAWKGR